MSAGINVNIDADAINRMVSESIINSMIGEQVKKAIEEKVRDFSLSYNNPIKAVVEKEVLRLVAVMLREPHYQEMLTGMVKQNLTDEVIGTVISKSWDLMYNKMEEIERRR